MYDIEFIRAFIGQAKMYDPIIPEHMTDYLTKKYVEKRMKTLNENEFNKNDDLIITPRSLLGIIRLSQAHARLRFAKEVNECDVNEALRLIEVSRKSIDDLQQGLNLINNNNNNENNNDIDEIFDDMNNNDFDMMNDPFDDFE